MTNAWQDNRGKTALDIAEEQPRDWQVRRDPEIGRRKTECAQLLRACGGHERARQTKETPQREGGDPVPSIPFLRTPRPRPPPMRPNDNNDESVRCAAAAGRALTTQAARPSLSIALPRHASRSIRRSIHGVRRRAVACHPPRPTPRASKRAPRREERESSVQPPRARSRGERRSKEPARRLTGGGTTGERLACANSSSSCACGAWVLCVL